MPSPDQIRILSVVIPLILIVMGIKRPVYAVVAYMMIVYCKVSSYYPAFSQINAESLFAVLILLRVAVTGNLFKRLSFSSSSINKYLFFFILTVLLSFLFAWDHQYSWDHAVYHLIKTLVLFVLVLGGLDSEEDLKIFMSGFILMFVYLTYEPLYGYMTGTGGDNQMYGTIYISRVGILSGHVALANNMNQMIPIVWFLLVDNKQKFIKIFLGLCLVIFFLALVGSGSRGGVVGLAVFGAMMVLFSNNRLKSGLIVSLILLILTVTVGSSLTHTASRISSKSTVGRLTGLTHGIGMLTKGNMVGVGPGCFLLARERYYSYRMESHNIYGQIMGDLGFPGMLATFLFVRELFQVLLKIKKRALALGDHGKFIAQLMTGVQVSLIVRLSISMASHGLYYFYWYVMAAVIVLSHSFINEKELIVRADSLKNDQKI